MKKLIVFDLDGTLATSKQAIDADMGRLFVELLDIRSVGVISGGDWPQFERQLLGQLTLRDTFAKLFLLPTSGTKFYRFDRVWTQIYADTFTSDERQRVNEALARAVFDAGLADDGVGATRSKIAAARSHFPASGSKRHRTQKRPGILTFRSGTG